MPGKVKVKIIAGRNLPVMDRSSDTTDAYVELKLGSTTYKTDVFRKSLNPNWNSDWFRFEVDDAELQDEPLQIRLMDYDTYSANDAIGKVFVDLNPLLLPSLPISNSRIVVRPERLLQKQITCTRENENVFSGFLPVFDTMNGIRGEVSVIVKVELFSDVNKFRQSSCGIRIFCSPQIPEGFKAQAIHGFVEELVVNDDPEYQWIDKIRTPRASNEARQTLFSKLSGEVRRKIGLKALELGGNAVVGYRQMFDLEGESGIVVRGIGTAVTLLRQDQTHVSKDNPILDLAWYRPRVNLGLTPAQTEPALHRPPSYRRRGKLFPHRKSSLSYIPFLSKVTTPFFFSAKRNASPPPCPASSQPDLPKLLHSVSYTSSSTSTNLLSSHLLQAHSTNLETTHITCMFKTPISASLAPLSVPIPLLVQEQNSPEGHHTPICFISSSEDSLSSGSANEEDPKAKRLVKRHTYLVVPPFDVPFTCHSAPPSPMPIALPVCLPLSSPRPFSGVVASAASSSINTLPEPLRLPSRPPARHEGSKDSLSTSSATPLGKTHSPAVKISQRRSSDSDIATTPKSSEGPNVRYTPRQCSAPTDTASVLDMLEYPFFTMTKYPSGFVLHFGGTVSARSVKLLEHVAVGDAELDMRDIWWTELRKEVRAHARALACNAVLGYEEHTTICEGVCVLSASGTAALINIHAVSGTEEEKVASFKPCHVCHIPYSPRLLPFRVRISKCAICKKGWVPDILIATVELPPKVNPVGQPVLVQARVARQYKREARGDVLAKDISDCLPFLQYELHRELINKLRLKGMNAIFGLNVQLAIGERAVVGVATGTALFLGSLPAPTLLHPVPSSGLSSGRKEPKSEDLNRRIREVQMANQETYGLKSLSLKALDAAEENSLGNGTDSESEEENPDLELSAGNKDTCVLQVNHLFQIDEGEEENIKALLKDGPPPDGVQVVSLSCYPRNLLKPRPRTQVQAFTRVWRGKFPADRLKTYLDTVIDNMMQSIYFKLRKLRPCLLSHVLFSVDLPEEDQLQVTVLGNAIAVCQDSKGSRWKLKAKGSSLSVEAELLFNLEEEKEALVDNNSVERNELTSPSAGIVITGLPLVPGAKIERYLGHLNFFFIRESTSIREGGGLSGFTHQFLNEVLAIVRAHVAALGGNAMVAYFMSECVLLHNPHKNQGQCLINVGGDIVHVSCVA